MGTYMIPRNTKGEGRILFIFSTKALILSVNTRRTSVSVSKKQPSASGARVRIKIAMLIMS